MKYLKKFNQHTDYETYEQSVDFIRPNVSWCVQERDVHYNLGRQGHDNGLGNLMFWGMPLFAH